MQRIKRLYSKFVNMPYKERTHKLSTITMIGNFVVASIKLLIALIIGSTFIALSGFATLMIGLAKNSYFKNLSKGKTQIAVPIVLLLFSVIYIFYMILQIVFIRQIIDIGVIPAVTVAAVSFGEIGFAIYGLIKSVKLDDKNLPVLKAINLCSAATALVLTQSVLLALESGVLNHYIYDASFGIGVGIICGAIAMILFIKIKQNKAIIQI